MIKIGKKGKILQGEYSGEYLLIKDDTGGTTGGYYICLTTAEDFNYYLDYWVENYQTLEQFFLETKWKIDWLE